MNHELAVSILRKAEKEAYTNPSNVNVAELLAAAQYLEFEIDGIDLGAL